MRTRDEKREDAIELKHKNAARAVKRQCYFSGCNQTGISSHILQENGILNQISENGKFLEYASETPFKEAILSLTGVKSSKVFTFNGFCNSHDNSIFKEIENIQSPITEKKHQLLFSYRGLVNDLYKAEMITDYFNRVFNDKNISVQRKQDFTLTRALRLYAKKDLQHYKMLMEKEIFTQVANPRFIFYRKEIPKIEIATSAIYGAAYYYTRDYNTITKLNPISVDYSPVSRPLFINLIPRQDSLIIIIGHVNTVDSIESIPVDKIDSLNNEEVFRLISRMLTKIETWGISKALHEKLKSSGKMDQYFFHRNKWLSTTNNESPYPVPLDFNLFENTT